ncbi:hypothetical protein K440DRAFT_610181 [Wilcoxina mikolae CBS 423.85]|nr:hypothetical protein K440DRAFT_610181 [Wilcoxina mikolae CBS 423.85]
MGNLHKLSLAPLPLDNCAYPLSSSSSVANAFTTIPSPHSFVSPLPRPQTLSPPHQKSDPPVSSPIQPF